MQQQQQQRRNKPQQQPAKKAGGGLAPMLALAALTMTILKATGVVSWSWTWVLSPLWLPLALLGALIALEVISQFSNIVVEIITERR